MEGWSGGKWTGLGEIEGFVKVTTGRAARGGALAIAVGFFIG